MAERMLQDRQDVQIWNAIEASQFKQALKLVDKKLSKKPTDYYEALKIYIRSQSQLVSEKTSVLLHVEELVGRKQVLADLEAVELYDEALEGVLPKAGESWEKIVGELRWQLVKALPKNEEAGKKCFKACLFKDDLDHARQIANSLEKNFPANHEYVFWSIATMYLYSERLTYLEKDRKLYGMLAMGFIRKLADATSQAADPKRLPLRAIHSPQELLLLLRILQVQGKQGDRLHYLQDPNLGPESIIAKGEWQLWRLKLELTAAEGQWEELFQTTSSLLKRSRTKNESGQLAESRYSDWLVWNLYIRAASEIPGHKYQDEVEAELKAHLDPDSGVDKSWRRNASLASLKFSFERIAPFSNLQVSGLADEMFSSQESGQLPSRPSLIVKYLKKYGNATTAYNDLRPFVQRLNIEERKDFLTVLLKNRVFAKSDDQDEAESPAKQTLSPANQDLATAGGIVEAVNLYKLIYLITSSIPERERGQSPSDISQNERILCNVCSNVAGLYCKFCLVELAQATMESYGSAIDDSEHITKALLPTDRHPADDLCILSAMCLAKLSMVDSSRCDKPLDRASTPYILQATILLEYAWLHSKANFQISFLLIRLYCYLGCGSLAMRAYQRLAVKQVQHDTLSHYMFDGISSFHPHPFTGNPDDSSQLRSPIEHFQKQHKFYKSAPGFIAQNSWKSFEQGNYNSIFELREVSQTLANSMSAVTSVVESRKISRLIQSDISLSPSSYGYDILPTMVGGVDVDFIDTNDYGSFPNFEASEWVPFDQQIFHSLRPSKYRSYMDLAVDKLMLLVNPISNVPGRTSAQIWLNENLPSINKKKEKLKEYGISSVENIRLAERENTRLRAYYDMACIVRSDSSEDLEGITNGLLALLEEELARVLELQPTAPAFQKVLHSLYSTYELGKTVIHFTTYLTRAGANVPESQLAVNRKAAVVAGRLVITAIEKSSAIKKSLDEGGWIDKILESVSQGDQDGKETSSIVGSLRGVIDENFMEEWAGQVVESWRDSIVGFSHFKSST